MAIFHPSRGGVRGGQDQFDWEDVKGDKDRECYLGHTVKAPTGRWQKGQDLTWFNKEKSSAGLQNTDADRRKAEIASIKQQEEEMMAVALGRKPPPKPQPSEQLSKAEMKMLMKGETGDQNEQPEESEASKADKIKGLGFSNQRLAMMGGGGRAERDTVAGSVDVNTNRERGEHAAAPGANADRITESSVKKRKKEKKEKKEKKSKKEKKQKSSKEERDKLASGGRRSDGSEVARRRRHDSTSEDEPRRDASRPTPRHVPDDSNVRNHRDPRSANNYPSDRNRNPDNQTARGRHARSPSSGMSRSTYDRRERSSPDRREPRNTAAEHRDHHPARRSSPPTRHRRYSRSRSRSPRAPASHRGGGGGSRSRRSPSPPSRRNRDRSPDRPTSHQNNGPNRSASSAHRRRSRSPDDDHRRQDRSRRSPERRR